MSKPIPAILQNYLAPFSPEIKARLLLLRDIFLEVIPDAEEAIKYGMPTIMLKSKNLLHYAAFKHHIGIYPLPTVLAKLESDIEPFVHAKGSIQFQHNQPLPTDLIRKIAQTRLEEFLSKLS